MNDAISKFEVKESFKVTVNQPPSFSYHPQKNLVVKLKDTLYYSLPAFKDPESKRVTVKTSSAFSNDLPAFIAFSRKSFTIKPTLKSQLGNHSLSVVLSDPERAKKTYLIIVTVSEEVG